MQDELRALLTNPDVFPIEITVSSGETIKIDHPDYIHYAAKLGKIFFYPENGGAVFQLIVPEQITKISGRVRKDLAWPHFFKGSSE